MHVNEDECLEHMLFRNNYRKSRSRSPMQRRKSKGEVSTQVEVSQLRHAPEDPSEFSANFYQDGEYQNDIELVRKENYVLSKTNEELRYIMREMQIRLNDWENDKRKKNQAPRNGYKALNAYKEDYTAEIVKNEEVERLEELLQEKTDEIKELGEDLNVYRKFVRQVKDRFGLASEHLDIEEIMAVYNATKNRNETMEAQVKTLQNYKEDTMISLQNLKDLLVRKENEIKKLHDDTNNLRNRNAALEEFMGQMKDQNSKSEATIEKLKDELTRTNELNDCLTEKIRLAQNKEASEKTLSENLQTKLNNTEEHYLCIIKAFENKEIALKQETAKLEQRVEELGAMLKDTAPNQRENRPYNADTGFNTSTNDEASRNYKTLYDKAVGETAKLEEEHRNTKHRLESELRTLEVRNQNLVNEKNSWSDRLNKIQNDYNKCFDENIQLKNNQRRLELTAQKVDEAEHNRVKHELYQMKNSCNETKAVLEYYQKENERLKRELTELKSHIEFNNYSAEYTLTNVSKDKDLQQAKPNMVERNLTIREVKLATPCKIIETQTRYERTPSDPKSLQSEDSTYVNSTPRNYLFNNSTRNEGVFREVETLRTENERLRRQIRDITDSNNRNVQEIIRLSNQLNEIRNPSARVN